MCTMCQMFYSGCRSEFIQFQKVNLCMPFIYYCRGCSATRMCCTIRSDKEQPELYIQTIHKKCRRQTKQVKLWENLLSPKVKHAPYWCLICKSSDPRFSLSWRRVGQVILCDSESSENSEANFDVGKCAANR